jgi:hypothetical protein
MCRHAPCVRSEYGEGDNRRAVGRSTAERPGRLGAWQRSRDRAYVVGAILLSRFVRWLSARTTDRIDARGTETDELARSEAANTGTRWLRSAPRTRQMSNTFAS